MDDSARSICNGRNDGQATLWQLRLLLQGVRPQGEPFKCNTFSTAHLQPLCLLQHRNKLASVTADTGIRIVAEAKRTGRGSAREAFLGALGRWTPVSDHAAHVFSDGGDRPARLTPQAPRKALILGTKVKPLSVHVVVFVNSSRSFRWRLMLFCLLPRSLNARTPSRCALLFIVGISILVS